MDNLTTPQIPQPTTEPKTEETSESPEQNLPQNWPPHIPYVTIPFHSPSLTPSHIHLLRTRPPPNKPPPTIPKSHPLGPASNVLILPISDPSHPAHGQHGLFAARDLAPAELVVVYLGEVHAAGDKRHEMSDYDLWLDKEGGVAVDAGGMGNEGRFVNDYRGVPDLKGGRDGEGKGRSKGKSWEGKGKGGSWQGDKGSWKDKEGKKKGPNAEFKEVWDGRFKERGMAVFVLPARKKAVGREREVGIRKGEEVLVSYGKGFWGGRVERGVEDGDGDGDGGQ